MREGRARRDDDRRAHAIPARLRCGFVASLVLLLPFICGHLSCSMCPLMATVRTSRPLLSLYRGLSSGPIGVPPEMTASGPQSPGVSTSRSLSALSGNDQDCNDYAEHNESGPEGSDQPPGQANSDTHRNNGGECLRDPMIDLHGHPPPLSWWRVTSSTCGPGHLHRSGGCAIRLQRFDGEPTCVCGIRRVPHRWSR